MTLESCFLFNFKQKTALQDEYIHLQYNKYNIHFIQYKWKYEDIITAQNAIGINQYTIIYNFFPERSQRQLNNHCCYGNSKESKKKSRLVVYRLAEVGLQIYL